MAGELELLPSGTLTQLVGHDVNGVAKRGALSTILAPFVLRKRGVVSVGEYAPFTGMGDETAAWQAALTAAAANEQIVLELPAGLSKVNANVLTFAANKGLRIEGKGPGVSIIDIAGGTGPGIYVPPAGRNTSVNLHGFEIRASANPGNFAMNIGFSAFSTQAQLRVSDVFSQSMGGAFTGGLYMNNALNAQVKMEHLGKAGTVTEIPVQIDGQNGSSINIDLVCGNFNYAVLVSAGSFCEEINIRNIQAVYGNWAVYCQTPSGLPRSIRCIGGHAETLIGGVYLDHYAEAEIASMLLWRREDANPATNWLGVQGFSAHNCKIHHNTIWGRGAMAGGVWLFQTQGGVIDHNRLDCLVGVDLNNNSPCLTNANTYTTSTAPQQNMTGATTVTGPFLLPSPY